LGGTKRDDFVLTREVARNTPDRQDSSVENTEASGTGQMPSTSPFGESSSVPESRRIAALQCAQNRPPQSPARIASYIYTVRTFSPLRWVRSSALGNQILACQFHTWNWNWCQQRQGGGFERVARAFERNWGPCFDRNEQNCLEIAWRRARVWLVGDLARFFGDASSHERIWVHDRRRRTATLDGGFRDH
jgi:hypothetical protein